MGVSTQANGKQHDFITEDTLSERVRKAEYAVRGEIVARAGQLQKELQEGKKLPFESLVYCNIGNPQSLGQKPMTFLRQVLSLCDYPQLIEQPGIEKIFPADALSRAKEYLAACKSTGAYSESKGTALFRKEVSEAVERRDGHACNPDELFLTDGASAGVHLILRTIIRGEQDAVLTPIPQYPLYSATLALNGGTLVPYYLDEESGWQLSIDSLKKATDEARKDGKNVRALVVINPGNPCGQVLTRENQEEILQFCADEGVVLMADEVYQDNIYVQDKTWQSFKKVMRDTKTEIPLVSMHSVSKGFYGECGRRGAFMELVGLPQGVLGELGKLASISLCSNIAGQIATAIIMNPPKEGEPSHELWQQERKALLESLKKRSRMLAETLSKMEGVTINTPEGALYAMPRIRLPKKAVQEAEKISKAPDFFYCKSMLEETGIVTVPGSGFQQVKGTFHFRTTFLPQESEIGAVCERVSAFHKRFLEKYGPLEASD
ncbi:hypothetical protein WJX73_002229 [Symbiochloris irregularis]|uniref:Aminotransferase class I/classII large domain-containing protein n=1 Tax=Symbiochloris irregularis TaxID=706552 RepID=A0AAW1P6J3_9CHLO